MNNSFVARLFRVLQCFVGWLLSLLWVVVTGAATASLFFGNFLVAWQAFTLHNFENVPLRSVPFLGGWADAFGVGDAPIASLYALVITGLMAVSLITVAKLVARALTLFFDWRQARRTEDYAERSQAAGVVLRLQETLFWLALVLPLALLVVRFDVALFTFRYEANLVGMVEADEALAWAPDPLGRLGAFLADFVGIVGWGYVGLIAMAAVAAEYAFEGTRERWRLLGLAIDEAIEPAAGADPRPARSEGQPAPALPDPALPAGGPEPAVPVGQGGQSAADRESAGPPVPVVAPAGGEPIGVPPPAHAANAPDPPASAGPEVDVVIGPGRRTRLPLAVVEGSPQLYTRDASGRHWFLRSYYESDILGQPADVEETADA